LKFRFSYAFVGFVLCCASAALADDRDPRAKALYEDGAALLHDGKFEDARKAFVQVLALEPQNMNALRNLAIAEQGVGRLVEALGHLKTYLGSAEAEKAKDTEKLKGQLLKELLEKTGHLRIVADRGAEVVLDDDTKLGSAPFADVVDVMPGRHKLTAGARAIEAMVGGGETKSVDLASTETYAADPFQPAGVGEPPREGAGPSFFTPARIGGGIALLGGAVSIVVGAVLASSASGDDDRAERLRAELRPQGGCPAGVGTSPACAELTDRVDDAKRDSVLGWTLVGVGAAAVIGGAVLVWPRSKSAASTTGVQVRPQGAGLALHGIF
jgi:tetratricopeptide (TPR) repeat protein